LVPPSADELDVYADDAKPMSALTSKSQTSEKSKVIPAKIPPKPEGDEETEETPEDDVPPPPLHEGAENDENEDEIQTAKKPKKPTSDHEDDSDSPVIGLQPSKAVKPNQPVDHDDEVDDDDDDVVLPASKPKPASSIPHFDDGEDESEERRSETGASHEEGEDDVGRVVSKQTTSSSRSQSVNAEEVAQSKSTKTSRSRDDIELAPPSTRKSSHDEDEEEVPSSKYLPKTGGRPIATLPSEVDEDDDEITETDTESAENEEEEDGEYIMPCKDIRLKDECEGREDCKWKYPKTQTTGFYCISLEKCDDAVVQKKSKCKALPNCLWTRVSSSSYGCRFMTKAEEASSVSKQDKEEVPKHAEAEDEDETGASMKAQETPLKTTAECEEHSRKSKCMDDTGCVWVRTSTQPTKYGCMVTGTKNEGGDEVEATSSDNDAEEVDADDLPTTLLPKEETFNKDEAEVDDTYEEEESDDKPSDEAEESQAKAVDIDHPIEPCSTIRLKSACRVRTDCYWKYPVSYSSGRYCVERQLPIKVPQERGLAYEALITGKRPLFDEIKLQSPKLSPSQAARWKSMGADWKRYKTDVSCALHPECVAPENITTDSLLKTYPFLDMPSTYIKPQCCTTHPSLRALFLQVTDFLNREGIPWWLSSADILSTILLDGYMLPWTLQITIEIPIFGSKTALDWAAKNELRSNLTSYTTTKTRILRSTKNEFASKLLQFNDENIQHLPNTMRACVSKFVLGTGSKTSSLSSYSSEWLKSERSGAEQCLVLSKATKLSSSKTPVYFLVSHVDEIEGKGPSIKIVPRILRTASADTCVEPWRPGFEFEPIPVKSVFPTVPCFGQGKFQGFTGVSRCPRDTKSYVAWQMAAKGKTTFLSTDAKENLEEFRKWNDADYCSRGLTNKS